jgi:hypothetical protein
MALVQTAVITGDTCIAVVTTLEAIIDWRVAFGTEDKASVHFIDSSHRFRSLATTRGEHNGKHHKDGQVSITQHDNCSYPSAKAWAILRSLVETGIEFVVATRFACRTSAPTTRAAKRA